MPKAPVLAAMIAAVALPVMASPWDVVDLGRLYKEHHCMQAARKTFESMLGEVRIRRVHASSWVTYADGINGQHDAIITCTYGDNRGTRATLIMHSKRDRISDQLLTRRLVTVFDGHAEAVTRAWRKSFQ